MRLQNLASNEGRRLAVYAPNFAGPRLAEVQWLGIPVFQGGYDELTQWVASGSWR